MRVQTFPCSRAKADADALKRESGRHYTTTMVGHYRSYRRTGHWRSTGAAERLEDYRGGPTAVAQPRWPNRGGPTTLHAHRRAAAQQGFYAARKVARRQQQQLGLDMRYPHRRRCYRTTTWQHTGIGVREGALLLARARGLEPVRVALPANFAAYPASAYQQVELVWDRAGSRYHWHVTLQDGAEPAPAPGSNSIAVDLGQIHPAAMTDGKEAVVVTARRRRATRSTPSSAWAS